MNKWILIVKRDLKLLILDGNILFNIIAFLLLISFNISMVFFQDHANFQNKSASIVFISYIISVVISSDSLFKNDYEDSSLDQLLMSGHSAFFIVTAKILAHWIMMLIVICLSIVICAILSQPSTISIFYITSVFVLNSVAVVSLIGFSSAISIKISKGNIVNSLISMPFLVIFSLYSISILNSINRYDGVNDITTDIKILASLVLIIAPLSFFVSSYTISKNV